MFLSFLSEDAKLLFLELAYNVAKIDDNFCLKEKELIDFFIREMGLEKQILKPKSKNLDELIEKIEYLTEVEKKIIIFEILGVIYADDEVHEKEKEFLKLINNRLKIENDIINKFIDIISSFKNNYIKLKEIIFS